MEPERDYSDVERLTAPLRRVIEENKAELQKLESLLSHIHQPETVLPLISSLRSQIEQFERAIKQAKRKAGISMCNVFACLRESTVSCCNGHEVCNEHTMSERCRTCGSHVCTECRVLQHFNVTAGR